MHVSQLFNVDKLDKMLAEGFVSVQTHPSLPLFIYNYTAAAQYAQCWNDVTIQCRGLILDADRNVVARPFPKFFNIEEHSRSDILFSRPFQVFEKLDGSLGILYNGNSIATRGSFTSPQAVKGTEMLWEQLNFTPAEGYTYLFEIIYPENRIVVDYGGTEGLIFLCAVHNETGANVFSFGDDRDWPGLSAKRYTIEPGTNPRDLKGLQNDLDEGFVLYFPSANKRMKVKFDEYVRLHRIVTGVSTKTIWKALRDGGSLDEILDRVPDEFYDWVRFTEADLKQNFSDVADKAHKTFTRILDEHFDGSPYVALQRRREFAFEALKYRNNKLVFAMLDDYSLDKMIWDMVEPRFVKPFSNLAEKEAI